MADAAGRPRWAALRAARRHVIPRLPWLVAGRPVGSVAHDHLDALGAWPRWLARDGQGLHLLAPAAQRSQALAAINEGLRARGLIRAWRDETFGLEDPVSGVTLATFERASTRFWGTLTRGAHCNGYVADERGRPSHLWISRRAQHKATDPGLLDNLVGGGVAHGQSPRDAVLREGWEEAGLQASDMRALTLGRVIRVDSDVPEGRMVEDVHVFDLELPRGFVPRNQDGEVDEISLMGIEQAAACAAGGEMTVDATLVTLDFLLRWRLLPQPDSVRLAARLQALLAPARA